MNTKDLSNEQLQAYFREHVLYEIQKLIHLTWAIKQALPCHDAIKFAPVESYAIHLRILITFLYPDPSTRTRKDDVCARDFFKEEGTWMQTQIGLSTTLKKASARVSKEVGHLTTARQSGTPASKVWHVGELTAELMTHIKLFCFSADKISLAASVQPLLSEYDRLCPKPL